MKPRLLLFDIDGTLIHKGKMGSKSMNRAFERVYGISEALQGIRLDGKTDWSICREVFGFHGLQWSEQDRNRLLSQYLECLEEESQLRPSGELCPGVESLLKKLGDRSDVLLALLTGNIRDGAAIKLRTFGILDYFNFGAYGCDREIRRELVPVALARATSFTGRQFSPQDTIVIGDTPADIDTAHAAGCIALAVATGSYTAAELASHRPSVLLDDLSDLPAVFEAIGLT